MNPDNRPNRMKYPEWRCVRIGLYGPGTDPTDMQGHYLRAPSKAEALREMQRDYPGEAIEAYYWKDAGR